MAKQRATKFTDVAFYACYPQRDIADHEVFLSFRRDEDAVAFRDWWNEKGAFLFAKWLKKAKE